MASCYILISEKNKSYYVGYTSEPMDIRLLKHNTDYYSNKWTSKGKPWVIFLEIECDSDAQARDIEKHIKSMKSKTYIQNLKRYPEMIQKLKLKYPLSDC